MGSENSPILEGEGKFTLHRSNDRTTAVKARGGVRGHFCMFVSYESTFYRRAAAFYGTKLSRRVKKLLSFEGRPSDNFSEEFCPNLVFLVHIFLFFDPRFSKSCLNGRVSLVLTKLGNFIGINGKI